MDELLHLRVADIGQLAHHSIDARVTIPLRVALGQPELNLDVGHEILELRNDVANVVVQCPHVGVEHVDGIVDLGVADVLRSVEMDDVEHDGNDQHLRPRLHARCVLGFCLQLGFGGRRQRTQLGTPQKKRATRIVETTRIRVVMILSQGRDRCERKKNRRNG